MDEDQIKCGAITGSGLFVICLSIAMIAMGCYYIDFDATSGTDPNEVMSNCTLQPQIPYYLLVAGILYIVLSVLRIIFQRFCQSCNESDNKMCTACGFLSNYACITFFDLIALTAIIVWLCFGTTWVFGNDNFTT